MKELNYKKITKTLLWVVGTPIALFLLLAILLYLPPVQRWAVNMLGERLGKETGLKVSVEEVRLAFPLDLKAGGILAVDSVQDTLLLAKELHLNVALRPLFSGEAQIDGFRLSEAQLNTKGLISDCQIGGKVGLLAADAPGVNWQTGKVPLKGLKLTDSDLYILLADTAKPDTVKTPSKWQIAIDDAEIVRSNLLLSLPGDSMHIGAVLTKARLTDGQINLTKKYYTFQRIDIANGGVFYDVPKPVNAPAALATLRQRLLRQKPLLLKSTDLNTSHIHLQHLTTRIDSLRYDSLGTLTLRLRHFEAMERSGLAIKRGEGHFFMDKQKLRLEEMTLHTDNSALVGHFGLGLRQPMRYDVALRGQLGDKDVRTIGALFLTPQQRQNYPRKTTTLDVAITGTLKHLTFQKASIDMPGVVRLRGKGWVKNIDTPMRSGNFNIDATATDLRPLFRFAGSDIDKSVRIPKGTQVKGNISFHGTRYAGNLRIASQGGVANVKGEVDTRTEKYRATLTANHFPLQKFIPAYTGSSFTGTTTVNGYGFDVLSSKAYLDSKLRIDQLSYGGYDLSGILFDGRITGDAAKGYFQINNKMLQGAGHIDMHIGKRIDLALKASFQRIEAHLLGLTQEQATFGGDFNVTAHTNRDFTTYGLHGTVNNAFFSTPVRGSSLQDMSIDLEASSRYTEGRATAGDLELAFTTKGSLPMMATRLQRLVATYERQVVKGMVKQEVMKRELPMGTLSIRSGQRNPLAAYLRLQGYQWQNLQVDATISPIDGINGVAQTGGLQVQGLLIDTATLRLVTDSSGLRAYTSVHNYKKRNPNRFAITAEGHLLDDGAIVEAEYQDAEGKTGVKLGAEGRFENGGMRLRLFPTTPVIAYRKFTINPDNYVYVSRKGFYSASIDLIADDGTGLKIHGEPSDSMTDLSVNIKDLNLTELSHALPMFPALQGMLTGDLHWQDTHKEQNFMVDLHSKSLSYEGMSLGDVSVQGILLPKSNDTYYTSAFITTNEVEGLVFNGTYDNSGEGRIDGVAQLADFPAQMLNGFLAGTDVLLDGTANGELAVKGRLATPTINGQLDLDSTRIYSHVYGFSYKMDTRPLVFEESKIIFDKYRLTSGTKEALTIDGHVDLATLANPLLDLAIQAKNFELVNAKKHKESLVYGKIYSDFDGTLRGTANRLRLRGNLSVLPTTDMTYILKDSPLSTDDRLKGLVEFTSFTDTTYTPPTEPIAEGGIDVILGIAIADNAKFHCDLSADGKSYVDIHGGGNLTLRMTEQGDMRLTGRYVINNGTMEYEMPVIPMKKFTIAEGSYVNFTGEPMNPTLNITATERTKAIVTESDVQRAVTFNTGLVITQTLENMGLAFTIEAPSDLAVTNELQAMSKEERGKVAVAMLATGMYLTDQSLANGTGFKASSALNAFLQSEIQQIAGSALKTVDISLGVEDGTSAVGTATTDYSFQFSKRFLDNRLTVNIGGRVSTGADAVNNGASFIDNISLEYRLDQGASRYVRMFYDRNTQDPFEGQITEAGVGLVLKKKTNNIGELFIFRRKKKATKE